ncbi:MAG: hypothetical protein PHN56_00895 [Candidatus Nanoarchaeia archaeon]|nr:hypothetical protein [Candidatus Nanoarchaeia archaeon]
MGSLNLILSKLENGGFIDAKEGVESALFNSYKKAFSQLFKNDEIGMYYFMPNPGCGEIILTIPNQLYGNCDYALKESLNTLGVKYREKTNTKLPQFYFYPSCGPVGMNLMGKYAQLEGLGAISFLPMNIVLDDFNKMIYLGSYILKPSLVEECFKSKGFSANVKPYMLSDFLDKSNPKEINNKCFECIQIAQIQKILVQ